MKLYIISFGQTGYYHKLASSIVYKVGINYNKAMPIAYDENFLPQEFIEYARVHPRGYGYWRWKPYIIMNTLINMESDDVLLYIDGRSHFKANKISFLDEFVSSKEYDMAVSKLSSHKEVNYSTSQVLEFFKATNEMKNSAQYSASIIVIRKNNKTLNLIEAWSTVLDEQRKLFRDDHNELQNSECFIENRHDQSALSLLIKNNDLNVMDIDREQSNDKILVQYWSKDKPCKYYYNFLKVNLNEYSFNLILRIVRKLSSLSRRNSEKKD